MSGERERTPVVAPVKKKKKKKPRRVQTMLELLENEKVRRKARTFDCLQFYMAALIRDGKVKVDDLVLDPDLADLVVHISEGTEARDAAEEEAKKKREAPRKPRTPPPYWPMHYNVVPARTKCSSPPPPPPVISYAVVPDKGPRVYQSKFTRGFHCTRAFNDEETDGWPSEEGWEGPEYFLLKYFIATRHPVLDLYMSDRERGRWYAARDARRWTKHDFKAHNFSEPTTGQLKSPAWIHELVFMMKQAEEFSTYEATPKLDWQRFVESIYKTENLTKETAMLGQSDKQLSMLMHINVYQFWPDEPRWSRKANLLNYFCIMSELVFFVDFYWRVIFPLRKKQREEVLLHLITMLLLEPIVEACASCTRRLRAADFSSIINRALWYSKVKPDPRRHLQASAKVVEVVILSHAWQVMLCSPAYYLIFMMLNRVDNLMNLVDSAPHSAADRDLLEEQWGGAKRSVMRMSRMMKETFYHVKFQDLETLRFCLVDTLKEVIPSSDKQRFKWFLECGLCHRRLQQFFEPVEMPVEYTFLPCDVADDFNRMDPRLYKNNRLVWYGRNVYDMCTHIVKGAVDFFPPTDSMTQNYIMPANMVPPKPAEKKIRKPNQEKLLKIKHAMDRERREIDKLLKELMEYVRAGVCSPGILRFPEEKEVDICTHHFDVKDLFQEGPPNYSPTSWEHEGIVFLDSDHRRRNYFAADGIPKRFDEVRLDFRYTGWNSRRHWERVQMTQGELAGVLAFGYCEEEKDVRQKVFLKKVLLTLGEKPALVTDEEAEGIIANFHATVGTGAKDTFSALQRQHERRHKHWVYQKAVRTPFTLPSP